MQYKFPPKLSILEASMKCAIMVVTHYVWEESTYIELQEKKSNS